MRVKALRGTLVTLTALTVASLFLSYSRLVRTVETAASTAGFIERG